MKSKARINKRVIVAYDGGFFSTFNTYLSHLVWGQGARGIQYILPDWSVDSIRQFHGVTKFQSFCYGTRADKNIWGRIFDSPYDDISLAELDDPKELYRGSLGPEHSFNWKNEPNLTYIHAAKLYRSPDFDAWRKWYHSYYARYIKPKPPLKRQVDELQRRLFGDAYVVSAHIRHPSHAMEQPNGRMAEVDRFLFEIGREVEKQRRKRPVKVFIATDQEKIVKQASRHFGSTAVFVRDAKRLTEKQDVRYEKAREEDKKKEGFQVAHHIASDEKQWSVKMAEEVLIDALLLARTDVMFHAVSNVATAVSFMNPGVRMNYLEE